MSKSEKNTAYQKQYQEKWKNTPQGKASRKVSVVKYCATPEGKAKRAAYWKEYKKRLDTEPHLRVARNLASLKCHLKQSYGITIEERDAILARQNHQCAICASHLNCVSGRGPECAYVDHNHTTGEVRGILCLGCNSGLGNFKESLGTLRRAQQYILDAKKSLTRP